MNIESLKNKAQDMVNLYIRLRYALNTSDGLMAKCYTCRSVWLLDSAEDKRKYHAGHYWKADKRSGHQNTRYDHDNIRPQCLACNRYKGGMMAEFGDKLLEELGEQKFRELGIRAKQPKKWTALELEQIITEHKKLLAEPEIANKLKLYNNN